MNLRTRKWPRLRAYRDILEVFYERRAYGVILPINANLNPLPMNATLKAMQYFFDGKSLGTYLSMVLGQAVVRLPEVAQKNGIPYSLNQQG